MRLSAITISILTWATVGVFSAPSTSAADVNVQLGDDNGDVQLTDNGHHDADDDGFTFGDDEEVNACPQISQLVVPETVRAAVSITKSMRRPTQTN